MEIGDPAICALIFFARVIDVSLGTFRTVMIMNDRRTVSTAIGFVEILIWVFAVSKVVTNLHVPAYALAYAAKIAPRMKKDIDEYPQFPLDTVTGHAAWTDWPWKLHRIAKKETVTFELYNLADDPMEAKDLANDAEQQKRLKSLGVKNPTALLEAGMFIRSFDGQILFIHKIDGNNLYNVTIYQPQEDGPTRTIIAKTVNIDVD